MNLPIIFWNLVVESAPWLLLGYLLAGVIKQLIPTSWVQSQLARPGFVSILKGALIGAPLPLCSCGVIPAALAIRKAGASKGATASFMVATPETGVDSIAFSYAVLGPIYAIARPIGALASALAAGMLVRKMDTDDNVLPAPKAASSCCSSSNETAKENKLEDLEQKGSLSARLIEAVKYGYGNMIADTAKWLAIGLGAAALISTFVPQSFFLQWGDGLLAMLVMVIVGLPMYICATASTPVAAGFLFAGISPGAALVFMLTGPATNIATIAVIREHLGIRSLIAYLVAVICTAIVCGLLLNLLFSWFGWSTQLASVAHHESFALWRHAAAIVLTLLVFRVWFTSLLKKWQQRSHRDTGLDSSPLRDVSARDASAEAKHIIEST